MNKIIKINLFTKKLEISMNIHMSDFLVMGSKKLIKIISLFLEISMVRLIISICLFGKLILFLIYFLILSDGHGMLGHEVSGYLRENLPVNMNNELKRKNKNVNIHNVNSILTEVFVDTNNKLLSGEIVDTTFSGSTCISLIYTPEKVITANVGDSRAVLGRFKDGGN